MQCHEIMTSSVETVPPRLSVERAARKMFERILGFLPVCTEEGRVVGVLTDRDIAVRVCAAGRSASNTRVEEVMSHPVVSCRVYDPVSRVERLMTAHRKARVIVTDDQDRLVGVISLTDLAQHEEPLRAARLLRDISGRAFRFEGPRLRSVPPPENASSPRSSRRRGENAG